MSVFRDQKIIFRPQIRKPFRFCW